MPYGLPQRESSDILVVPSILYHTLDENFTPSRRSLGDHSATGTSHCTWMSQNGRSGEGFGSPTEIRLTEHYDYDMRLVHSTSHVVGDEPILQARPLFTEHINHGCSEPHCPHVMQWKTTTTQLTFTEVDRNCVCLMSVNRHYSQSRRVVWQAQTLSLEAGRP